MNQIVVFHQIIVVIQTDIVCHLDAFWLFICTIQTGCIQWCRKTSVAFAASAELVLSANVQIVPEKQVPAARSKEVNFVVCFNMENLTFLLHDGSI